MTRLVIGLVLVLGWTASLAAQTQPASSPSYYSAKAPPTGNAQSGAAPPAGTQPIRRTAGEAPVGNEPAPPRAGGNVISQPPATIPANGANPVPPGPPRPNPTGQPLGLGAQNGGIQAPLQPQPSMLPPGFPLSPQEERHVDQLLQQWELQSGQIQRFKCEFQCWEYDPTFGPKDKAKVFSKGEIKYMGPDKGLLKETESRVYSAPKDKGGEAEYNKQPVENLKHWVCDGKQVFEFDAKKKEMIQRVLPPEMQGKAIAEGPLPFLFGANAAKMKSRYWIRPISREGIKDAYALVAIPKTRSDAANFKMVHIVLDAKSFMPQFLELYPPNYDEKQNAAKATYAFSNLDSNWNQTLEKLNPFHKEFFEPSMPSGWKKVVEDFNGPNRGAAGPAGGTAGPSARPPAGAPSTGPATGPAGTQATRPLPPTAPLKK